MWTTPLSLEWQPAAAPLHILAGAGALAVLAVAAYARSIRSRPALSTVLLAMRLAAIALLGVLLMGPSRLPPPEQAGRRPRLRVVVDTSGSMQTADCAGKSRIRCALEDWLTPAMRQRLEELYEVEYLAADATLRPLGSAAMEGDLDALAAGRQSRLVACVTEAVQGAPAGAGHGALLVISDGRDSEGRPFQPAALVALARGLPVYAVCLGGPAQQRDVAVVAMPRQEYLLAGEPGQVAVRVVQSGLDEAVVTVRLRTEEGEHVETVAFRGQPSAVVNLPLGSAAPGLHEAVVSVDPAQAERETGNNIQSVFYEVTEQRIRVLLLEGQPHWDTRALAQSLRKDARVELTQVTQISPQRCEVITGTGSAAGAATGASSAPAGPPDSFEALARYDVVILGRGLEALLDHERAGWLAEYVAGRGGSVVFARGRAYDSETPTGRQLGRDLAVLEPVVWGRGVVHNQALALTSAGRGSPCFALPSLGDEVSAAVAALPGLAVMPVATRENAGAIVLARAVPVGQAAGAGGESGAPGVAVMNYGRGKVLAVLGEGLWRWGMLPPQLREARGLYDAFWSNTIRWMAMGSEFLPGQQVAVRMGRSSVRLGDLVTLDVLRRAAAPEAPRVQVVDPAGQAHDVPLRPVDDEGTRFQASFEPVAAGVHRVLLEAGTADAQERKFSVYDVDAERLEVSAAPEGLGVLAEQSGGRLLTSITDLPTELLERRAEHARQREANFVWDRWPVLAALLLWIGAEWFVRRRAGMA